MNSIRKKINSIKTLFLNNISNPIFLARSVSVGIYIAFSPFIGLHTALIFLSGWMFSLSIPIIFAVSLILHNPWTMVLIYSAGYFCGTIVCSLFSLQNSYLLSLIKKIIEHIPYIKMSPESLMEFIIGGNVLGIFAAIIMYPVVKYGAILYNQKQQSMKK
jgi:uncharacterized protein (DUF2062 family)